MKTALIVAAVLLGMYFAHDRLLTTERTIALRPGQSMQFDNAHGYRGIHVRAAFPVTVVQGDCRAAQVVDEEFHCSSSSDVLTIQDVRINPFADFNRVTVRYSLLRL